MNHLPNLAEPDNDPRLWLEEIEGHDALAWVEAQNARTLVRYADAGFAADRDALAAIYDRPDNIPFITRRGRFGYNFWKDASNPRGKWRRTTLASYKNDNPDWEVLLDLDMLAIAEGEDWIWRSARFLSSESHSVILSLSRGGSDATILREFEPESQRFVDDGFNLPEAKQSFVWWDESTLLVTSTLGENQSTTSGYARSVRLWKRGTDFKTAQSLFEVPVDHMHAYAMVDRSAPEPRILFEDQQAFFETVVHVGDITGPRQKVALPSDAWWRINRDFIAIKPRTAWVVDGITYPPDTLCGARFSDILHGRLRLEVLFEPGDRRSLKGFFWAGKTLIVSILDNLRPTFTAFDTAGGQWQKTELASLADDGLVNLWAIDERPEESNGDLLISVQGPLTPSTLLLSEQGKSPEILKRAPAVFVTEGLVSSRHEAISSDGERIPYVQVGPTTNTGDAPVLMYGYGGFGNSQLPYYNVSV